MKTTIKLTLNSLDPFDSVIIDHLAGQKNRAGAVKKIMYDHIMSGQVAQRQAGQVAIPAPVVAEALLEKTAQKSESDKELDAKLSKFGV